MFSPLKMVFFYFRSIFLLPHVLVFKFCKNHDVMCADVDRWREFYFGYKHGYTYSFLLAMVFFKEYRNVFYLRLGNIKYFLRIFCKPVESLYLASKNTGPGLFIQHGFSTIVGVQSMGKNCMINQQVTVGFSGTGVPIIGDNVQIKSGAIIIGNIKIGDNCIIGAGAVVVKDVPPNCVVVGSRSYIIRRDGVSVREAL